jgi:hypothetical protein
MGIYSTHRHTFGVCFVTMSHFRGPKCYHRTVSPVGGCSKEGDPMDKSTCSHCGMSFYQDDPRGHRKMCPTCRALARELSARRDPTLGAARMRLSRAKAIAERPDFSRPTKGAAGDPKRFTELHCEDDSRGRIPVSELWHNYRVWCASENLVPVKRQELIAGVLGYQYGLSASAPKSVVGLKWKEARP